VGSYKARRNLGLTRVGDGMLVGLTVSATPVADAVDEIIRRNAFQRAAAELARGVGNVTAGQVGDHGVVFLSTATGSTQSRQRKLDDLADRAGALARKQFGLSLYCGTTVGTPTVPLSRSYQAALGAAESALARGVATVAADAASPRGTSSLGQLRQALRQNVERRGDLLAAQFDRYIEAVAGKCAYRVDLARVHLEVGFVTIAESVVERGLLDPKGYAALVDSLDRAAGEARTASDLFDAYRMAVADLSVSQSRPVIARQDRSLRSAMAFIHQHYADPLLLEHVARVAGFAPGHFSRLFKQRERITFERYLFALRLDQAKRLLADTDQSVTRVAELSGFRSVHYFCRAFRQTIGVTPLGYRRSPRSSAGKANGASMSTKRKVPKYKMGVGRLG
jgi:AraC-like DNA-binding protein